jgi:calmodulin
MDEEEKIKYWNEIFVLYDKDVEGEINLNLLPDYLSAVGIIIEKKDLKEKISEIAPNNTNTIRFNDIWNAFHEFPTITNEQIINAFKTFDKGGKISKEELKYMLTNLGDKINEEETEKIFKIFKIEGDEIDYQEFLNRYEIN